MNIKKYLIVLLLATIFLSACGSKVDNGQVNEEEKAVLVGVESLADQRSLSSALNYSATVRAEAEANIYAKVSGTMISQNVQLGDNVEVGEVLANLDSASNLNINSSQINSTQIRQAQVALSQAQQAYNSALTNYDNLVQSIAKDIKQAELSLKQSKLGQDNLDLNFDENFKSAQINYQSTQEATLQAKNTLINREQQLNKSITDLNKNILISISSSLDSINSILLTINNITGFDDNNVVNINYKNNLGALDSSALIRAKNLYNKTKNELEKVSNESLAETITLVYLLKDLSDSVKLLFSKTITSSNLNQIELSALQSQASSFQTQSSALLNSLTSQKQAQENLNLELNTSMDVLNSAYQLALKQEASAKQNLNNLEVLNNSQTDQASLSVSLAENQLANLRIKGETQLNNARSQIDISKLQYENSILALEALYDNFTLVSPLNGQLSLVNYSLGDTVAVGSLIFRISQINNLKLVFFVDSSVIDNLSLGQELLVDGQYLAYITNISPQADEQSKKFQLEAKFSDKVDISINKIVNVEINIAQDNLSENQYYLPLSALFITQTESYFYSLNQESRVKKQEVEILDIIGETAKINFVSTDDNLIIVENNRRLKEGQLVEIK